MHDGCIACATRGAGRVNADRREILRRSRGPSRPRRRGAPV